jgi:Concanavalin A-like lectin/glucanases superfamily
VACDPLWNKTSLVCQFEGSNNATTFTEEKGRTLTANGDAKLSTAQYPPITGRTSSLYLDGTDDYVSFSAIGLGFVGDFTIEAWIYVTALTTYFMVTETRASASFTNYVFGLNNVSSVYRLDFVSVGGAGVRLTGTSTSVSLNTWTHVAVTRKDGVLRAFVAGTVDSTTKTYATPMLPASTTGRIGSGVDPTYATGYIGLVRITQACLYTESFTPDTSALLTNQCAISGVVRDSAGDLAARVVRLFERDTGKFVCAKTSDATTGEYVFDLENTNEHVVLAHDISGDPFWPQTALSCEFNGTNNSTTFTDEKGHAMTAVGDAKLTTTSPKIGSACGTFDGTGDYVTVTSSTDFDFGGGDFTVEFYFKTTQTTSLATMLAREWGGSPYTNGWTIQLRSSASGPIGVYLTAHSTAGTILTGMRTDFGDGAWHHLAWVKYGDVHSLYLDGVLDATAISGAVSTSAVKNITIGNDITFGPRAFNGQIDALRITKAARYIGNFTPDTTEFLGAWSTSTENVVVLDSVVPV